MSILLRTLRKIHRDFAVSYKSSPKSLFQSTIRWKSIAADVFKAQRVQKKKEPVEVYKWILLVRLLSTEL